jgi:uncharacterized protein (DUF1330 family)
MAAYLIGQIIIHDMEKFMPYVANTSTAIAKYGGEVLDVVEAKEVMEGNWPVGARTALVRFQMKRHSANSGTLRRTRR